MNMRLFAAAVIVAAAGSTQAALFSFSSSSAGGSWTFQGNGGSVTDATGPNAPITLDIDDNNGVLPTLNVSTQFNAAYTLTFAGTTSLGGGVLAYNYTASGSFSFQDMVSGTTILSVSFQNCLYSARGNSTSWFTTGGLQGDNGNGAVVHMTWGGASLPGYGLTPGPVADPQGFAFDLSALNTSGAIPYGGQNPGVGLTNNLPNAPWFSEGSFSGSTGVPAPGSLALLGVAGLTAARRRRR